MAGIASQPLAAYRVRVEAPFRRTDDPTVADYRDMMAAAADMKYMLARMGRSPASQRFLDKLTSEAHNRILGCRR